MTTEMAGNGSGPTQRSKTTRRLINGGALIAVLVIGAAGGAGAYHRFESFRPRAVLLLQPAPIAQMTDRGPVAVKGHVEEVFGNKFIVQDDSGRTLVDTGRRGESATPVTKGETVTIQGRLDRGIIHANVLTRADGTSESFDVGKHPPGHGRRPPAPPER